MKLIKNEDQSQVEDSGIGAPRSRIAELAGRLRTIFPLTEVRVGDRGLTVLADADSGFPVTLELIDETVTVSFGPGLIEFDDFELAFKHVVMACSDVTRLTVVRRGNRARRWHLEARQSDDDWQRMLSGGYTFFDGLGFGFGRKDETITLRNNRTLPLTTALAYGLMMYRSNDPAA